jgi:hypothetical protein
MMRMSRPNTTACAGLALALFGALLSCAGEETSDQGGEGGATSSSSSGQTGSGGAMQCTGPEACDDQNVCTQDSCEGAMCVNAPALAGTPCEGGKACDESGACANVAASFSKGLGGPGNDAATAVAVDSAGNLLVAGTFEQAVDFGAGPLTSAGSKDIFVVKLDPSGDPIWSKSFGGAASEMVGDAACDDAGNVILVGSSQSVIDFGGGALPNAGEDDVFVVKLDPDGKHVWSKQFGASSKQFGESVAVDGGGNVVLSGRFEVSIDFGAGPLISSGTSDIFITKLGPSGALAWAKSYGEGGIQLAPKVAVDSAGNIVSTGGFEGMVDFGGGPVVSAGGIDVYILKLDPSGKHMWSKAAGDGTNLQMGGDIGVDSAGNVVVTGTLLGSMDFGGGMLLETGGPDVFVVKLDPNGGHMWSKDYGDRGAQGGAALAVVPGEKVAVTGAFGGTLDFGGAQVSSPDNGTKSIFLAELDASGAHVMSARSYVPGIHDVYAVAADKQGNVVVAGSYSDVIGFGNGDLPKAGATDIFVAKFAAAP